MERDDHILEENDMLVTQGNSKTRDDARLDVKKLSCAIELVHLVDQRVEALIDGLADHFATGHQLLTSKNDD